MPLTGNQPVVAANITMSSAKKTRGIESPTNEMKLAALSMRRPW